MSSTTRDRLLEAYRRHSERRNAYDWRGLAETFAEDARYFDPMFGWQQGRAAIGAFLESAMDGLATRVFADLWHVAEDDRLVIYWQCSTLGVTAADDPDSLYHGMSALRIGEGGLWVEQMDIYDREQARGSRRSADLG